MSGDLPVCFNCHRPMPRSYWHPLTSGQVNALIKFRAAVVMHNRNSIHLEQDMDGTVNELSRSERSNWTMLRFHGLVAKVREPDGRQKRGHWLLTARGASFLRGDIELAAKVMTANNKVTGHSIEKVSVSDVLGRLPAFTSIDELEYEVEPGVMAQERLL